MKKNAGSLLLLVILLFTNLVTASNIKSNVDNIHPNFTEYVNWLKQGNKLVIEVTVINPASSAGTHYFTAWGKGNAELLANEIFLPKLSIFFSDRKAFKGNKDSSTYLFNTTKNSVEVVSHTWGNGKTILSNLKKVKNTMYSISHTGAMTVFNFKKVKVSRSANRVTHLKITPRVLTDLCPHAQVGGDFDFGGNGPRIKGSIELNTNNDKSKIEAIIRFNAKETKSDWSEVEGTWIKTVYKAPYGKKIKAIKSPNKTTFNTVLRGGGRNELFGGGSDGDKHTLQNNNGLLTSNGPVRKMIVVGDTGGWDISTDNNCSNDTRIVMIEFGQISIELENK